jgi:signal peptidase I
LAQGAPHVSFRTDAGTPPRVSPRCLLTSVAAPRPRSASNPVADLRSGKSRARARTSTSAEKGGWRESLRAFLGTVLIFLVIRAFLVEAFRIPSGSMIPTLLVGDWLFVNKLVYGPHIPFTTASLPGYADPKRNDVVVFESPVQPDEIEQQPTLVKRLVAVPGDTILMRKAVLYVNGVPQRLPFAQRVTSSDQLDMPLPDVPQQFDWKSLTLRGSRFDAAFGAPPEHPSLDTWGPFVVPAQRYFMMGDNRYCSKDSRFWGLVPRENLRGRPIFVYYSYRQPDEASRADCRFDESDRALPFITDIRWARIGHRIK